MDPPGPVSLQQAGTEGQRQGDAALLRLMGGIDVLQKVHGGAPRLPHKGQEALEIPLFQRRCLAEHPLIVPIEVHRPEKGPVRHLSPELTQAGIKLRFAGPAQHILPQAFGHGAHLLGNGRIFVGEICMAAPGVDEAQRVAIVSGPAGNGLHHRGSGVCEVDEAEISHRRGALIHQPGGLSKVDVFSELPHLGDQYRGHFSMIIKAVEDGPHQHLIGGGGGEPRAGQHIGAHIGVKTSKPQVQLVEPAAMPRIRAAVVPFSAGTISSFSRLMRSSPWPSE